MNYEKFCEVTEAFDAEEATSIANVACVLKDDKLKTDLAYVLAYFGNLPNLIEKLEKRNLTLVESLEIVVSLTLAFERAWQ